MMAVMMLLLSLAACGGGEADKEDTSQEQTTSGETEAPVETTAPEDEPETETPPEEDGEADISGNQPEDNSELFIEEVTNALDGQVGEGEKITSIKKDENNLIIKVDLSGATNTHGIPLNIIAESRCSSITDAILELEKDDQWETITIDFGDVGSMTCGKSDIEENEYGRYISMDTIMSSLE